MLKRLTVVMFAIATIPALAQTKPVAKKLLEFGWDEPTTAFMRAHIAEMEQTPFDGTVFTIAGRDEQGKPLDFMGQAWGTRKFSLPELKSALDDLKATHFKKFTDNFLRFDVTPGNVDWFDPFDAVLHNASMAARIAHAGGARGILFDVEPYSFNLWNYSKAKHAKDKSFDEYQAQVRARGRELMTRFQNEFPDIKIFLTFGFTLSHMEIADNPKGLPAIDYGLLPALLNGMLDVAAGQAQIIDGYEPSYAYKTEAQFAESLKIRERSMNLVADKEKYAKHYAHGYGIWMDEDWRKYGWSTTDFSKNFFTPETFAESVRLALQHSDEYVWIYTEKPWWWSPKGQQELPKEYVDALERAKEEGKR
jgi:hypothetical protein